MKLGAYNLLYDASHGSSGKGAVSTRLADIFKIPNVATCNGPNAGHWVRSPEAEFVFKAMPSPCLLPKITGHKPQAWIGPNSSFEIDTLIKEFEHTGYKPGYDLFIHARAAITQAHHKALEAPGGGLSVAHVASTMSGAGATYAMKAMRMRDTLLWGEKTPELSLQPWDFAEGIQAELAKGRGFLHEVAQGFALSLDYGTELRKGTYRNCTPQQALADMMILPHQVGDVYMNCRSYPIRVGNFKDESGEVHSSGSFMDDSEETSWEQIGVDAEMPEAEIQALLSKELTTVTKRLRRVFTPSWALLEKSAKLCGATKIVLNFTSYIHWSSTDVRGGEKEFRELHPKVRAYVDRMEDVTGLQVVMLGTGADHNSFIWRG
jgi:adenylosuccinate synthase